MSTKIKCPTCHGVGRIWDKMEVNKKTNTLYVGGTMRNCKTCKKTGLVDLNDLDFKTVAKPSGV